MKEEGYDWNIRIRPGNPRKGRYLKPEDFYSIKTGGHLLVIGEGIKVAAIAPSSRTLILDNDAFCITVHRAKVISGKLYINEGRICLPTDTKGEKVLFKSPAYKGPMDQPKRTFGDPKVCSKCSSPDIELESGEDDLGAMFWWHCYNCGFNEEDPKKY